MGDRGPGHGPEAKTAFTPGNYQETWRLSATWGVGGASQRIGFLTSTPIRLAAR
ncbi:MAG: hypothetical protein AB1505_26905 [Candidatus Latescibacterota bacterium]